MNNTDYDISNAAVVGILNSTYNYWGSQSPNFTAIIYGNVSYTPWFSDVAMTQILSKEVEENQTVADNETVQVGNDTDEVVIPINSPVQNILINSSIPSDKQINISLVNLQDSEGNVTLGLNNFLLLRETLVSNYSAEISAGTVISGGSSWDGKISLPTIKVNSDYSVTDGDINVVVDLGSSTPINFSNAVKVVIGDMAGKSAAWSRGDGSMTVITTKCNNVTNHSNIVGNGECYVDDGADLIIWTKHFTRFAAYTISAPVVTDTPSSGGGGGGSITWPKVTNETASNETESNETIVDETESVPEDGAISPLRDGINTITGAVVGTVNKDKNIRNIVAAILIIGGMLMLISRIRGGMIGASYFTRASNLHRRAGKAHMKGNYTKSGKLYGKAQILREKGERKSFKEVGYGGI